MTITWVVVDFETASATNLKKAGAWVYAECPTTEILCLSYQYMANDIHTWVPGIDRNADYLLELVKDDSVMFVAFNVQFEKAIWCNIMPPLGWPDIPDERWHDVQAVSAYKNTPLDLDRLALVLRLNAQKDAEGSKFTIGLSKPNKRGEYDRSPEAIKRVVAYCEQDIVTETSAHRRLGWLPPGERRVWLLNQKINQRGLRIDLAFVRKAQEIVDKASKPLLAEFAEITGGLKPGQRDKFLAWMDGQGVKLPNLQKEYMTELLGENVDEVEDSNSEDFSTADPGAYYPVLPDHIRRALVIRQLVGSTSIKKLERMVECTCADGRAKGLLQYHGTGPGRSAGRLFQPHNFPRGTIKTTPAEMVEAIMTGDPNYLELTVGPAIECIVSALRHALVPDPDRIFLAGDYAGIQARTVLAVAGQHDKTALMSSGVDIYCDMARQIYKVPVDKKKDPEKRQVGKNSVLGLGFQMGAKKFQFKYGRYKEAGHTLVHPIEFCETVVHAYRKEWAPKVPYVWYGLQDAATKAVWSQKPQEAYGVEYKLENGWLSARLPSGRKIWYFNPKPIKKAMPWDKDDIREAFQFNAMKMGQWKTIDAFGGQLTENVVMGIERDLMTCAMLKCEDNGMPVVLEVHDEIIVEPLKVDADEKAFEQIMLDVPDWCRQIQIPVAVETWQGDRYKK